MIVAKIRGESNRFSFLLEMSHGGEERDFSSRFGWRPRFKDLLLRHPEKESVMPASSSPFPNLVMLTWHDAGDWFGCYDHATVQTPHTDRLAAGGVRFTRNFSACAICSPSRAAMMTGRTCQANGVLGLTNTVLDNRIHPHIPHLGARLAALGYHNALFGVQHECAHEHAVRTIGLREKICTDPWPNGDLLAGHVRRWLGERRADDGPFYAQIGTYDAHLNVFYGRSQTPPGKRAYLPVQDTSRGLDLPPYLVGSEADQATVATLQGQLQRGDRVVGAVLEGLEAAGLTKNTLVVINVDHGVGLDRAKTTCYDPGTRTAWLLHWPAQLPAHTTVDALTCHLDVLPTIWELLGLPAIEGLDGCSFASQARGQTVGELRDAVFTHMLDTTRAIRTDRFKWIRNFHPPRYPAGRPSDCALQHTAFPTPELPPFPADGLPSSDWPLTELYDLEADPWELHNLAETPEAAVVRADLDRRLWTFLFEQDDPVLHAGVRTPWAAAMRRDQEAFCRESGREPFLVSGPAGNRIDAAAWVGE